MSLLLVRIVPLAVGAAVSPTLVAVQLLYLSGSGAMKKSLAFAVGVTVPCIAVAVVILVTYQGVKGGGHASHSMVSGIIDVLIGAVLLVVATISAVRKPKKRPHGSHLPNAPSGAWSDIRRPFLVGLGMELSNITSMVIFLSALKEISLSGINPVRQTITAVIFIGIMLSEIYLPVIGYALAPERIGAWIGSLRSWLETHQRAVIVVAGVVFGIFFLGKGIKSLVAG